MCYNQKNINEDCDMITKEQVWKGLKLELPDDELCKIFQADEYEVDDYYDYDLLMETLYKAINKEIDFEYFIDWCILVANCYNYTKDVCRNKLGKLYCDVGYFFDGISFMDRYDKNRFMESVAMLKHYNYLIKKAKKEINGPFETNGVERILIFDHCNRTNNSSVYRVFIRDYNKKEWELTYIDDNDFEYDENINYTFEDEKHFNKYFYEFYEDETWKEVHNLKF